MRASVRVGPRVFDSIIAATPADRERGLQGHSRLNDREGMLFMWPGESASSRTFHMGTVSFPIAIMFVKDRRVKNLVAGLPGDRQRWTGYCDAVFECALSSALGLHEGDVVDIDDLLPGRYAQRRVALSSGAGELADVALLAAAAVQGAIADESRGGGVQWQLDALTGQSTASAVIGRRELRRWLAAAGLPEAEMSTVMPAATQPAGWSAIGDAFVGAGLCDLARQTAYGLVLQRLR